VQELTLLQTISVWALPVLLAITLHEAAHGWVADRLGDPTATQLGRVTANPLKHIDLIGTIAMPMLMLVFTPVLLGTLFVLGWAKPVPVVWKNLRSPKRDMAIVAAAGPLANLIMLVAWALVLQGAVHYHALVPWVAEPLGYMSWAGVVINAILMVINLVPVPPLDGGRVLVGLLPGRAAYYVARIEPFGMLIVIALLVSGALGWVVGPAINWLIDLPSRMLG